MGANARSSAPPRRTEKNGVKNLHGSKIIPKSPIYHGNKDFSPLILGFELSRNLLYIQDWNLAWISQR